MTEVLHDFGVLHADGRAYHVRACGSELDADLWQGWIEFEPIDGVGEPAVLRSPRETTQPNRTDAVYWATGPDAGLPRRRARTRALHPQAATGRGPAPDAQHAESFLRVPKRGVAAA